MLQRKKILLGITGSIAAYKTATLTRLLIKEGAEVKIVMTNAAKEFVTPLSLSTLSKQPVLTDLSENDSWANHVMLGRWADIMLIAPASCNTIAKMAGGICDNLLLAVYLSATCPVAIAPAMDEDMWQHNTTRINLKKIGDAGNLIIPVGNGELASGLIGEGRMAEPEEILHWLHDFFSVKQQLHGKKALVTAGPTFEAIDPVRFIGNHSSGKMGVAIAEELAKRGAEVTLVLGPSDIPVKPGIQVLSVTTAAEMYDACELIFPACQIAVMCAAVADYTPVQVADQKIKKKEEPIIVALTPTRDILKSLGQQKKPGQILVGFALETQNEKENAIKKLTSKNADLIVLNSLNDKGAGFGYDTNKITIFDKAGGELSFDTRPKKELATEIVNSIIHTLHAQI